MLIWSTLLRLIYHYTTIVYYCRFVTVMLNYERRAV